jgi:hypothetical protein
MAKRSRPTDAGVEGGSRPVDRVEVRKRTRRLERKLADLEATEARRVEQLEKVRVRVADLRARLAALAPAAAATDAAAASAGPTPGPTGYCMREKRRVQIGDPVPVTLSNGRAATSGTCMTCGARIVALTSRTAPSGG